MSKYLDDLIFDRTVEDIQKLTDKAYIDYNDLNRVEAAIKWVSHVLNKHGYRNTVHTKMWKINEWRTDADMRRIKNNLEEIKRVFFIPEDTPVIPDKITYTSIYQANAIEKIIHDVGRIVENMSPGQRHLGFRLGTRVIGNRSV